MKNPFRRRQNEVDRQITTLREISAAMQEAAEQVRIETSAPMLRRKLAELDPRLLDLLIDQSHYEVMLGDTKQIGLYHRRAIESSRAAMRPYGGDTQVKNAALTWTDWGFGRQVDVRAVDAKADEIWQECWTAARNRAVFGQRFIHELSKQILTDGELFFIGYASRQDGTTTWRTLKTEQVTDIIHAPNDDKINVWYIVTLDDKPVAIPDAFTLFALRDRFEGAELPHGVTDINASAGALANGGTYAVIVAAQRNLDSGRGWPEFTDAIPWSNVLSQMYREAAAVFSAAAMFIDKIKIHGGQRTVNDVIAAMQSSLVTGSGYGETNPRAVAGSSALENDAFERTRLPWVSAGADAQTSTGILALQLATALGVKASDVGRVDMFQNKATADIAAESPQQRWQRYQLFWADVWGDVVETTLRLWGWFNEQTFENYEAEVSSTLPLDLDTTEIATAIDAIGKSATAMTLDYGTATRATVALTELLLLDLGVSDVEAILQPQQPAEAALPAAFGESHTPVTVRHVCPLCGFGEAHSYEGHGALLVCAGCGKTYDPECE